MFDLEIKGHANNRVVQNVARNIISRLVLKFEGEILLDLSHYNILETYRDLYKHKKDRENMTLYGIQNENMRKMRSEAADAQRNNGDSLMFEVYKKKYAVKLQHPLTSNHGVAYPSALGSHIEWEITLAPPAQLIVSEDITDWRYSLMNIQMEYETIKDDGLARDVAGYYNSGKSFLYEHVHHFRTIPFNESDKIINENVNVPRRSMKGLLILFTKVQPQNQLDSELFINPSIESVSVTIEGIGKQSICAGE